MENSIISTISFSDNADQGPLVCQSTASTTLSQILQRSGFTKEDIKNISFIIDKNSSILHSASGSLFLSHQAISEGYLTHSVSKANPISLRYESLKEFHQIKKAKKFEGVISLFDVFSGISELPFSQELTFSYFPEQNERILNKIVPTRFTLCKLHGKSYTFPIAIFPTPKEFYPKLRSDLNVNQLYDALMKAHPMSQTAYEISTMIHHFVNFCVWHFFAASNNCKFIFQKTVIDLGLPCNVGGHALHNFRAQYPGILFRSIDHVFRIVDPENSWRKCQLFGLQKQVVDVMSIFIDHETFDRCTSKTENYKGFEIKDGDYSKVYPCNSVYLTSVCLHTNLYEYMVKHKEAHISVVRHYFHNMLRPNLYEKMIRQIYDHASYYVTQLEDRDTFLETSKNKGTLLDFKPILPSLVIPKELFILRDLSVIVHRLFGGHCINSIRRETTIVDPDSPNEDENFHIFLQPSEREEGFDQFFNERDGSIRAFVGPVRVHLGCKEHVKKIIHRESPYSGFERCRICVECVHGQLIQCCSNLLDDNKPVLLTDPFPAQPMRENSNLSLYFRRKDSESYEVHTQILSDLFATLSDNKVKICLANNKIDYYNKILSIDYFLFPKDLLFSTRFFDDRECFHSKLLEQFSDLNQILAFVYALNSELRFFQKVHATTYSSIRALLAQEVAQSTCLEFDVSVPGFSQLISKLSVYQITILFGFSPLFFEDLNKEVDSITSEAFRLVIAEFYEYTYRQGMVLNNELHQPVIFQKDIPVDKSAVAKYIALVSKLKNTYYETAEQLSKLRYIIQGLQPENLCSPYFKAWFLKNFGINSKFTEQENAAIKSLNDMDWEYCLLFQKSFSMGQNPLFCSHSEGRDSNEHHSFFHTLRKFVPLQTKTNPALLSREENVDALKHAIGPFLNFLSNSKYADVHKMYQCALELGSISVQHTHVYSYPCECASL